MIGALSIPGADLADRNARFPTRQARKPGGVFPMCKGFRIALAAAGALGLAGSAFAQTMVEKIDVTVDLAAIGNADAAAFWTDIAPDLESALAVALAGQLVSEDSEAATVSIDIDEMSLADAWEAARGTEASVLAGTVTVTHEDDNSAFVGYDLTVTFAETRPYFLPGTDLARITPDSKEYYDAMIAAFADNVAAKLK